MTRRVIKRLCTTCERRFARKKIICIMRYPTRQHICQNLDDMRDGYRSHTNSTYIYTPGWQRGAPCYKSTARSFAYASFPPYALRLRMVSFSCRTRVLAILFRFFFFFPPSGPSLLMLFTDVQKELS